MHQHTYSVKNIKRIFIVGILVYLLGMGTTALLAGGFFKNAPIRIIVFYLNIIIVASYFLYIYSNLYVPNTELEDFVNNYEENEKLSLMHQSLTSDKDLIDEIKNIILSLDTMAIKQKNAEILMKNAEINNLQDQINPHFLYNTLEVIRGEALVKGEHKIAEMTASLANYFRYNISRRDAFVFLKDELKNSMNYFNIQKNRFGDKISCEVVYDDIDQSEVENCYIPKLILQPVIENAIYHGLELKMGKGKIRIHITAADSSLKIVVADDGLGISKEKLDALNSDREYEQKDSKNNTNKRNNGVAMRNIKNRLKLYWDDAAYMVIVSDLGVGTQVHLSMPLLYQIKDDMNLK